MWSHGGLDWDIHSILVGRRSIFWSARTEAFVMADQAKSRQNTWLVIVIIWLTLLTRFLLSDNPKALENIDAAGFDLLAQNLSGGHGFTMNSIAPFCPESVRTPAYPLFLTGLYGVFGRNVRIVFLSQGLLDLIVAAVIYRLSGAFYPRRRHVAGIVGLLFYLIALSQWRFDNELLSEGLLTPLLALSVF